MNKTELVSEISKSANLTKNEAKRVVAAFVETVSRVLAEGDDVTFLGFGKFSVVKKAARKCRNPHTGKTIKVPARKAVKFKVGKRLAEAVK